MENLIITDFGAEFKRIRPADGYRLYNNALRIFVSEAVVKEDSIKDFVAVQSE